jgi:hypothetical protein
MSNEECIYFFFNNSTKKTKDKPCKQRFISKLQNQDYFTQNEIHSTNKLRSLSEYKKYYYLFDSIENRQTHGNGNMLTKYENLEVVSLDNYLRSLSSSKLYILRLIEVYRHILSAIALLKENTIIHNNINLETIQTNKSHILLTNFSESIDISRPDLKECINKLCINKQYMNKVTMPLEFQVLSYLITNKLDSISNNNITSILDNSINNHQILTHFGEQVMQQFRDDGAIFLRKYINKSITFIIDDILTYYSTWDNYALSVSYLIILIDIHKSIKHSNKFVITFMRHLLVNISFNPIKRCSVETTTNKFNKMIYEIEPNYYALLINEL